MGAGAGGGRCLLLNGHIDAVDVAPREQWLSHPFTVAECDGSLCGRGVSDMKGGIACLVVALETLRRLGGRLAGDVVFCTVTDDESSGSGGRMAVERGVKADAGIAAESTDFDAWVSCRGTVTPTITVEGSGKPAGLDSWHDAATFTAGGTPTFSFGADGIETAHAVNERASVQSLPDLTAAVAVLAMRWCGVSGVQHQGGYR